MAVFEMVKYHSQEYPTEIPLRLEEIAAHFDATSISSSIDRSLHTEYSYGKRALENEFIYEFPSLISSQKYGVPQLWKSHQWAQEFAHFVIKLSGTKIHPKIIEVHPPFNDYTDISGFVSAYYVFEEIITDTYPETEILIENRCGSVYRGGKFLFSKLQDISALCDQIEKNRFKLKIAYDVPQIYTAHNVSSPKAFIDLLDRTKPLCSYIGGVHLWGKSRSKTGRKVAHCGDLTSYFENDTNTKDQFLEKFNECFSDGIVRKMVLEVNSGNNDLLSIIADLREHGVEFC